MRLPRWRRDRVKPHGPEQWLVTADLYARKLTETGSRCHHNDGSPRFCHWVAQELPAIDRSGSRTSMVGVRCTMHPGGRFLDSGARLDPEDFA